MPESGAYGSARGVPGVRHPYRDRQQPTSFVVSLGERVPQQGVGSVGPRRQFWVAAQVQHAVRESGS